MAPRLDLHDILVGILGSPNVYYQPPPSVFMKYPAIVYRRDDVDTTHANNKPYINTKRYQVTVIDPNVDSEIPGRIAELPSCTFDRFYTAENLNHDVFNIFF
jgi:hypothetical protein